MELNSNLGNDTYKYYDSIPLNTEIKISHKAKIKKYLLVMLPMLLELHLS